jgi:hypothetical protein
VVTKECREQWESRYKEYRRESSALYDDASTTKKRETLGFRRFIKRKVLGVSRGI